jgi:ABC-type nitrate/sulfonate/bicarbonate transport system substrate-binding protein
VQAALAGEIRFITSAGVANINASMSGADFVGLTATLNTFVFKIIANPELKKPEQLKGKKGRHFPARRRQRFSIRYALTRWSCSRQRRRDYQVGGEQEEFLALQNKAVDAVVLSEPFASLAIRSRRRRARRFKPAWCDLLDARFRCAKSFIQANRDVVIRFISLSRGYLCL